MSRKKGGHGGEIHADERWLITYADMITLLLAVFIVLYALSDTNVRKFAEFAQSVSAAFSTDVFSGSEAYTISSGQQSAPDTSEFDAGNGLIATDYRTVEATIRNYAINKGLESGIKVDRVSEGIAIRISTTLLFSGGRATLDDKAREIIAQIAGIVGPLPNQLRVEGHTDDVVSDSPFYADNWELSSARALTILRQLIADGVDQDRLAAAGYGEFHPLVPNTDDDARARNRRVDVLILYLEDATGASGAPGSSLLPEPITPITPIP